MRSRLAARFVDTFETTEIRDWWGGTQPEVLLANDVRLPGFEVFYRFGGN